MKPMMIQSCSRCGLSTRTDHPIRHCFGCEREAYNVEFARLVETADYGIFLGVDPYRDAMFFWKDGHVFGVEGRLDRMLRHRKMDEVVDKLTALEAENKDLLAENARLRRRLDVPAMAKASPKEKP